MRSNIFIAYTTPLLLILQGGPKMECFEVWMTTQKRGTNINLYIILKHFRCAYNHIVTTASVRKLTAFTSGLLEYSIRWNFRFFSCTSRTKCPRKYADMDVKFHIHGNPAVYAYDECDRQTDVATRHHAVRFCPSVYITARRWQMYTATRVQLAFTIATLLM